VESFRPSRRISHASTVRDQAIRSAFTDRNGRSTTTMVDPAYATRRPEINFQQDEFASYQEFLTYVRLRQKYEQRRPQPV
jgi:hypothetical protein